MWRAASTRLPLNESHRLQPEKLFYARDSEGILPPGLRQGPKKWPILLDYRKNVG
jgi:hypothetical protein